MGTSVQIELTLDSSGAVTGVQNLGSALDDVGNKSLPQAKKRSDDAFGGIEAAERRAHIAGQLFGRFLGIELPRSLETVISRSQTLGPILAGAFNVAIIATAVEAAVGFAQKIVEVSQALGGMNEATKKMFADAVKASNDALANPKTLAIAAQHEALESQVLGHLQDQATEYQNMSAIQKAALNVLASDYAGANEEAKQLVNSQGNYNNALEVSEELQKNAVLLVRAVRDANLASQAEINEAGLKGFALIQQQHRDEDRIARASFDMQSGMSDALAGKLRANAAKAAAAAKELYKGINDSVIQINQSVEESMLQGDAKINEHLQNSIANFEQSLVEKTGMTLQQLQRDQAMAAVIAHVTDELTRQADFQRAEGHRQTLEKITQMESDAAIASLPEWQRADAQILADRAQTFRQIDQLVKQGVLNEAEGQQERIAADQLANARMRDEHKRLVEELGADLSSLWDDIASGNIGKRILDNIKKLIAQMIAQWILGLGLMKSAAGSILGSIVFGPGTMGSNIFGGGNSVGGGQGSLLGGLFGGGSSPQSAVLGAGSAAGSSAGLGLPGAIAGTSAITGGFSASSALTSTSLSQAAGSAGSTAASSLGGGKSSVLGGLFSAKGLTGLAGIGSMLGSAMGGRIGQIGGLLSGLAFGPGAAILAHLGISGALAPLLLGTLAFAGAGLTGFGLGNQFGTGIGALSGAGTGALTGFLVGGPIGALVGGLIGLLGGIFGGLFGGSKRKKQANALVDNTILPDIQQIVTGFDSFQIDNSSAIQQLEQLRTDAQKQLSQLKSQGKDVFNSRVNPAIDDAEKHIRDIETERERRAAIVFGPPQFAAGGVFTSFRNAGLAVLHDGEYVVNPQATKKNRAALDRMNSGWSSSGAGPTIIIQALDGADVASWLKRGGGQKIADHFSQMSKEGKLNF